MKKGKLYVIEGLDGSGKGTQAELLFGKLKKKGIEVRKVSFPNYASDSSAPVRMYLRGDFGTDPSSVNAYAASSFYAVDRYAGYKADWGASAARYLSRAAEKSADGVIEIVPGGGVRYTVPSTVDTANCDDLIHLRFRVRDVYKSCEIVVAAGGETILSKKKRITVPSEMEDVILKKKDLEGVTGPVTVSIAGV